jgi:hypothetical protein
VFNQKLTDFDTFSGQRFHTLASTLGDMANTYGKLHVSGNPGMESGAVPLIITPNMGIHTPSLGNFLLSLATLGFGELESWSPKGAHACWRPQHESRFSKNYSCHGLLNSSCPETSRKEERSAGGGRAAVK